MDTKTWIGILRKTHGELLIVIPDGRDFKARARRESAVRFSALHEFKAKWVKEAWHNLGKCPFETVTEYLDRKLEQMAERN